MLPSALPGLDARRSAGQAILAWTAVALVVAGTLVPAVRVVALLAVAAVAIGALARRPTGTPAGPAVAWIAVLPVIVGLTVGLAPDPRVPDPGTCADILAPPVVRRVSQAAAVLGVTALLATRMGGRRSLGLVMPPDRRVAALALASPLLVPVGLVAGPLLAGPFFGDVHLGLPSLAALVPATILALANAAQEEVAYRGATQRWSAPALGATGGLVAQALIFGSAHQGSDIAAGASLIWIGMVLAGLVAGLIAARTGSLLLPFAVHVALDVPLALALTCRLA